MPEQFSANLSKALRQKEEYLIAVDNLQSMRVSVISGKISDRMAQRDTSVYPRISVDDNNGTTTPDPTSRA